MPNKNVKVGLTLSYLFECVNVIDISFMIYLWGYVSFLPEVSGLMVFTRSLILVVSLFGFAHVYI